jgi:hypothetical protein
MQQIFPLPAGMKIAHRMFYRQSGLLVDDMPDLTEYQKPFAQQRANLAGWKLGSPGTISLMDVLATPNRRS